MTYIEKVEQQLAETISNSIDKYVLENKEVFKKGDIVWIDGIQVEI